MTASFPPELNRIYEGNSENVLKTFDDESVDLVVTSPPYYGLRDYKMGEQIGMENTPQEYIQNLVKVFAECKRVLKKEGSLWVNIGDSYASSGGRGNEHSFVRKRGITTGLKEQDNSPKAKLRSTMGKSLIGIPERFVIAMTDELGLIRRNTIIWHKSNCMPSSATDRFTIDFEYFYFFTKSPRYFFETQYEPFAEVTLKEIQKAYTGKGIKDYDGNGVQNPSEVKRRIIERYQNNRFGGNKYPNNVDNRTYSGNGYNINIDQGRIKRTVWKINPVPFPEAHFAVFPEKLVETPIKACCPSQICVKCGRPRTSIYKKREYSSTDNIVPYGGKNMDDMGISNHNSRESQKSLKAMRELTGVHEPSFMPKYVGMSDCGCGAGFHPGTVLDPFMGSGTVAVVAKKQFKGFVGVELNRDYIKIANKRLGRMLL